MHICKLRAPVLPNAKDGPVVIKESQEMVDTPAIMVDNEDWRLQTSQSEDLRGASFVLADWTPPPPEWVAVYRNEDGGISGMSLREEPGPPGWNEGDYPVWDHDHCALCSQRLSDNQEYEDSESAGWRTGENVGSYSWVCMRCFTDLREHLEWTVFQSS
jgi:hypothetical protein